MILLRYRSITSWKTRCPDDTTVRSLSALSSCPRAKSYSTLAPSEYSSCDASLLDLVLRPQSVERRAYPLQREPSLPERRENHPLSQPDERDRHTGSPLHRSATAHRGRDADPGRRS